MGEWTWCDWGSGRGAIAAMDGCRCSVLWWGSVRGAFENTKIGFLLSGVYAGNFFFVSEFLNISTMWKTCVTCHSLESGTS